MYLQISSKILLTFLISILFLFNLPVVLAKKPEFCFNGGPIPDDGGTPGLLRTLTVSDVSGTINDLNVKINADHNHVADLVFTLEHNGTEVTIIDRPGYPALSNGCAGKNIPEVVLDDEASNSIEHDCANGITPAYTAHGSYRPNNSLSAFNGQEISGEWNLTVKDKDIFGKGSLKGWCLEFDFSGPTPGYDSTPAPGNSIDFGQIKVGETGTQPLDIRESGDMDLKVWFNELTGEDKSDFIVDFSSFTIAEGAASQTINIDCKPSTFGDRTAILELGSNDPDNDKITYELKCTGLAPAYDSMPIAPGGAINFGSTLLTKSNPKTLKIMNIGNQNMLVDVMRDSFWTPVPINGTNATDFQFAPLTRSGFFLPPNATQDVILTCIPSDIGQRTATLNLVVYDASFMKIEEVTYTLTCNGTEEINPIYHSTPIAPGETITFPSIKVGDTVAESFYIEELGTDDLQIHSMKLDDPVNFKILTPPSLSTFTIANNSNERQPVEISCEPKTTGIFTGKLEIYTNTSDSPIKHDLKCEGLAKLPIYDSNPIPGEIFKFGSIDVGKTKTQTVTIKNIGEAPLTVELESKPGDFSVNIGGTAFPTPLELEEGTEQSLTIQCAPSAIGERGGELQFATNDPENPKPSYQLECTGTEPSRAGYASTPYSPGDTISFGRSPIGEVITKTFEIEETGNLFLEVKLGGISGSDSGDFTLMTAFPIVIPDNASKQTVTLQCKPSARGKRQATLRLTSNDETNRDIKYQLACTGTSPAYQATPASKTLNFGEIPIGLSLTKTLEIQNTGNDFLKISKISLDDSTGDFTIVKPLIKQFTIPEEGATKTITVQCKPTKEEALTAQLELVTSDPANPNPLYQLKCQGMPALIPGYDSSPAPNGKLSFGSTGVGETIHQTIELQETGNKDLRIRFQGISGEAAADYQLVSPKPPFNIADGGEGLILTVQCQPSMVGARRARLEFTTNVPLSSELYYDLECTGIDTQLLPSTQSRLVVKLAGGGQGNVRSDVIGINCGNEATDCIHIYEVGQQVTLTAKPAAGSQFQSWGGNPECDNGQLKMNDNYLCIAYFKKLPSQLTVETVGGGQVTSQPTGIDCDSNDEKCAHSYKHGAEVKLTATPEKGWQFEQWKKACDNKNALVNPATVILNTSKICQAVFVPAKTTTLPPVTSNPPGTNNKPTPSQPACSNANLYVDQKAKGGGTGQDWTNAFTELSTALVQGTSDNCITEIWVAEGTYTLTTPTSAILKELQDVTIYGGFAGTETQRDERNIEANPTLINGDLSASEANLLDGFTMKTANPGPSVSPTGHYTLTVNKKGSGNGEIIVYVDNKPITCDDGCTQTYPTGKEITLVVHRESDSEFINWDGACKGTDDRLTLNMTEDKNCGALFEKSSTDTPQNSYQVSSGGQGCPTSPGSTIEIVCDYEWRATLKDITVGPHGNISQAQLEGLIVNKGWISRAELRPNSSIIGGTISGDMKSYGTLINIVFMGNLLEGGMLAGEVDNPSPIGGIIKNVSLAPDTVITHGKLSGQITGDRSGPALLKDLVVTAGTRLTNVIIGPNVRFEDNVFVGENVTTEQGEPFVISATPNNPSVNNPTDNETQDDQPVNNPVENETIPTAVKLDPQGQLTDSYEAEFTEEFTTHCQTTQPNHALFTRQEVKPLKISANVSVRAQDVGLKAELVAVREYRSRGQSQTEYQMRAQNRWKNWSGDLSQLFPFQKSHLLREIEVVHFEDDLSKRFGEFTLYIGYRLLEGIEHGAIIFNGVEPIHFFVESAPESCIVYAVHDEGRNDSQFLQIDLSKEEGLSGVMTTLGDMHNGLDIEGLALEPENPDILYGTAGDDGKVGKDKRAGYLYKINRLTGELLPPTEGLPTGYDNIPALAFNSSDDNQELRGLWGWTSNKPGFSGLIKIDPDTGESEEIQEFDLEMGGLAWLPDGSKLYASNDSTLWVYDPTVSEPENRLTVACENAAARKNGKRGKIEGLDAQPNGILLMGVDYGSQGKETSIVAYDPEKCEVVNERTFEGLEYNDMESIIWPAAQCNDQSWMTANYTEECP